MEEQEKIILRLKVLCKDIFEFGFLIPQTYWQTLRSNILLLNLAVESKGHPTAVQFHDRPLKRTPQSRWPTSQQQSQSTFQQTSKTYKSFKLDCKAQDFFFAFKGKPSAYWLCKKEFLGEQVIPNLSISPPFNVTISHTSSSLLCVWAALVITTCSGYSKWHLYFGLYSVSVTQLYDANTNWKKILAIVGKSCALVCSTHDQLISSTQDHILTTLFVIILMRINWGQSMVGREIYVICFGWFSLYKLDSSYLLNTLWNRQVL